MLRGAVVRVVALRDSRAKRHEIGWRDATRGAAPRCLLVADDAPLLAMAHEAGQVAERAQVVRQPILGRGRAHEPGLAATHDRRGLVAHGRVRVVHQSVGEALHGGLEVGRRVIQVLVREERVDEDHGVDGGGEAHRECVRVEALLHAENMLPVPVVPVKQGGTSA